MKPACVQALAEQGGLHLSDQQYQALARYAAWLREEAIPAGGLGPNEGPRLWPRHLCDALAYALVVDPPRAVVDVGTGVGLPGIPLGILWPQAKVDLVDRSARRIRLVRRALRILQLPNVAAHTGAADDVRPGQSLIVTRAAFPPEQLADRLGSALAPGGILVAGLHRGESIASQIEDAPPFRFEVQRVAVLDPPAWFLIMQRSE